MDAAAVKQLGLAKVMTMTSTYDHRVIQGAESGSFLRLVDQLLQGDEQFYDGVIAALGLGAAAAGVGVAGSAAAAPTGEGVAAGVSTVTGTFAVGGASLSHVAAAMGLVKAFRTH